MKNKRENGEVVVEASIIVTLVVIVISIMFYIGMVLYQQTAISTVANRTATNISQVYSNTLRDPFTGYLDPDNAYQSITYSNMKTDAYLDSIKQKGTAFAQYRLKKSQIIPAVDREVDIQVVNKPNEILKGQIVVTITDTYDVPLVGMFGLDSELTFTATGRADCVDYLEYLLGVEAIADPENSPIPSLPDSDTCIVTFVKDKYSGGFHAAVPVLRGKTIITSNNHSHCTMPENPELNGMKFTGWVTDDGRNFSASIQVDENMTVYGTWNCKITFDPTGGTIDPATKTVEYKKTTTLPAPTKNGFEFLGWYSDVEYSEEYKSNNGTGTQYISGVTEIPGNITLYAKWKCIHSSITKTEIQSGTCQRKFKYKCTCDTCPYEYEEYGSYGSHQKGDLKVEFSPTCTTDGSKVAECKLCSATLETQSIAKLGHNKDNVSVTDATCTKEGKKEYFCSRCETLQKTEKIKKLGHNLKTYKKESTCQEKGYSGKKCVRDGCDYKEGTELNKKKHSYTARCGTTHYYYNTGFKIRCYGSKGGSTLHEWKKGFQCVTCEYCGHFEPLSYDDSTEKLYKGYCRRRYIKVDGDNKFLYSSETVWCVEHKDFDDVKKVVPPNHNIYDCTNSNYKKDSNYDKKIKP